MTKLTESLCVVVVKWVDFDPIPKCTSRCLLMLATNGFKPNALPFVLADAKDEVSISQAISSQNKYYAIFMSPVLKIPPTIQPNEYSAISYFLAPRSVLNGKMALYVAVQDEKDLESHSLPGNVVGFTDFLGDDLKHIFGTESHLPMIFPATYTNSSTLYNEIASSKCTLELACLPYGESMGRPKSDHGYSFEETKGLMKDDYRMSAMMAEMEGTGDKEKWQILSKELGQKQELINRMMKEIDEKKQSLKLTGAEIVDLRRSIKLLQNENAILRKRLGEEEQIQLNQMVTKEISKMSSEELRVKIIKLAQAYRAERLRNEEFDKALKGAHAEISAAKKMEAELDNVQNAHQDKARKLLEMQREIQKINLYKDTIKKQEKVITKLEGLLNKTIKDTKQSRQDILELEKLKTENFQLQKDLKSSAIQRGDTNPDVERYRREIARLEEQVASLQKELKDRRAKTPGSGKKEDEWEMEKIELEVKLHKAEARNNAMEEEMQENAKAYGKQIADLRAELMQKESMLQSMTINSYDTIIQQVLLNGITLQYSPYYESYVVQIKIASPQKISIISSIKEWKGKTD
eukprot:TRINITY_DN1793_c0_g1_i1.p2 TRINITY_DN1793_c0_g1~~TRINITY_DN1793_c0_g1_i1.p2  ORF type:complete len:578 (+),score=96.29 TRINITY_DN1793_c0_g1_i1:1186-2919(+)